MDGANMTAKTDVIEESAYILNHISGIFIDAMTQKKSFRMTCDFDAESLNVKINTRPIPSDVLKALRELPRSFDWRNAETPRECPADGST